MSFTRHRFHVLLFVMVASVIGGCASTPKSAQTVLPAPAGTSAAAVRHHDEGILAYQQGQWESAKQHFEAAITASPELAEAHYNLGMVLYRLGALREGDAHFITAANLAPGDKIIWNSPPLAGVPVPEKDSKMPGHGGSGHSH
jgi:tetratricopeptide (TPR) repeat protein